MKKPSFSDGIGTILKNSTKILARAGVVGGLYAVLTLALAPISYGAVQFRVSEALTILPLIFPETAIGLTIGCFIANIFGNGPLDMILGTIATLTASIITAFIGKHVNKTLPKLILGSLPPILINAFIVPVTFMAVSDTIYVYLLNVLTVFLGQAVVIAILGPLIYFSVEKIAKRL